MLPPQDQPSTVSNFISYLNTLQRIHGGNENALAEFQAQTPLFASIAAPHPLEDDLVQDLNKGTHSVILTGHAGDGKTTLAFAVYRRLLGLPMEQPLPDLGQSVVRFSVDGHRAILIKDLSEQERSRHDELMNELLDRETRSILVSNTGALLEFFLSQALNNADQANLESRLLTSLSKERDDSFVFKRRHFKIYNLAMRDNLPLAEIVLSKMLAPELWPACSSCRHQDRCPVYFNRMLLTDAACPARRRLFLAYRRLQAYGVRLTMRQLTEHLAFCLTGGLDEAQLCRAETLPQDCGDYHLYNVFFGGPKAYPATHVADMAAIRAVHTQKLGAHPLPCMDKQLWHVLAPAEQIDTLGLPAPALEYFLNLAKRGSRQTKPEESANARLQARRLLYFCANPQDQQHRGRLHLVEKLQTEFLRSPSILLYTNLNTKSLDINTKRHLMSCLFHVLQEHYTGIHLPAKSQLIGSDLYITLNRPTPLLRQSVQAVICSVPWKTSFELRVKERPGGGRVLLFVGNPRGLLRNVSPLELTVPFLDYIQQRYEGEISNLPRASFGQQLNTLKSQIVRCMRDDETEDKSQQTMKILCYCSDYRLVQDEYILSNNSLEVYRELR